MWDFNRSALDLVEASGTRSPWNPFQKELRRRKAEKRHEVKKNKEIRNNSARSPRGRKVIISAQGKKKKKVSEAPRKHEKHVCANEMPTSRSVVGCCRPPRAAR